MRSPFAIFRKHARVLTVVLTGLAMFAFIVMDQIQDNPQLGLVVLGALLLGGAFWILGRPSGHANEYGIGGLLVGVIMMAYVFPYFNKPPAAVQLTIIDSLTNSELRERVQRIRAANQFVASAKRVTRQQQRERGEFGFGGDLNDDAVMTYILSYEADQLGIELSDEAVSEFIKSATDSSLSRSQFKKIRTGMQLSESVLYDVLREQLRARLAMQMLMPREFTTPADYWEYFRRLNVKQEIIVTAVPVKDFESEGDPPEAEVALFFEKYKNNYPGFISPEPAFRQPRRIRLAYLEVSYDEQRRQVEKQNPVSDSEIEEFYEKNKDDRYKDLPSFGDEEPPFEPLHSPDENEPIDPVIAPDPIDPVIAPEPGSGPELKDNQPGEKPPPKKDAPGKKPDDAEKSSRDDKAANGAQFSLSDDSAIGSNTDTDDEPAPPALPEDPPMYLPLDDELRAEIREELLHQRTVALVTLAREQAITFLREIDDDFNFNVKQLKLSPTREEIDKYVQEIAARGREINKYAKKEGLRYEELDPISALDLIDRGKEAADVWNQTEGAEAEPTKSDGAELKYLIAQATELRRTDDDSRTERPDVVTMVFGTQEDRLFSPESAEDDLSNNQYVFWKIDNKDGHVPELADVREQVVAALKQFQARKPARERAETLAADVRQALKTDKSMEEVLEGITVTGKQDGLELSVLDTGESFSWLTIPTAQSPNPFFRPPPDYSKITSVEHARGEFMRVVFNELGVGEVGVAQNADRSVYYVVQVKTRTPETSGGELAFQIRFMREKFFGEEMQFFGTLPSSYTHLTNRDHQEVLLQWSNGLFEKYGYKRAQ